MQSYAYTEIKLYHFLDELVFVKFRDAKLILVRVLCHNIKVDKNFVSKENTNQIQQLLTYLGYI